MKKCNAKFEPTPEIKLHFDIKVLRQPEIVTNTAIMEAICEYVYCTLISNFNNKMLPNNIYTGTITTYKTVGMSVPQLLQQQQNTFTGSNIYVKQNTTVCTLKKYHF
jgi:hypothetical protein